ncbi:MAG: hypothetical protein AAB036_06190 [Elusimicrobiota bacterium]
MLIAAALALPCSALSPETSVDEATAAWIARLEESVSASAVARSLLAGTRHVPRRQARDAASSDAISVRAGSNPVIVVNPTRLPATTPGEAEVLYMLAAARAELAFPLPVLEAEQAAWQKVLLFCVERGAADPRGFGALLAQEVKTQSQRVAELERSSFQPSSPWAPTEIPVIRLPAGALARAGLFLHLVESDPQRFYWAVETGSPWPRGSARLVELEDVFALRAKDIAALTSPPQGPYATLGGKRYPGALIRAAYPLRATGEVERLREALQSYDSAGLKALEPAINRWRRSGPFP